jgi:hypothetical protein
VYGASSGNTRCISVATAMKTRVRSAGMTHTSLSCLSLEATSTNLSSLRPVVDAHRTLLSVEVTSRNASCGPHVPNAFPLRRQQPHLRFPGWKSRCCGCATCRLRRPCLVHGDRRQYTRSSAHTRVACLSLLLLLLLLLLLRLRAQRLQPLDGWLRSGAYRIGDTDGGTERCTCAVGVLKLRSRDRWASDQRWSNPHTPRSQSLPR